ncbi:MAG: hypothetical protein PUP91_27615 [Rhizonema sp. PD37]|nr:hypothetical protein [Rhizonema sp. PD37]
MNKILIKILIFGFLLLFIISPFASLASLMLFLLATAVLSLLWSIIQAIIGGSKEWT